MEKITGNEPISARVFTPTSKDEANWVGITIRQELAARAMQGLLASYAGATTNPNPEAIANQSIRYADALITALNKQEDK